MASVGRLLAVDVGNTQTVLGIFEGDVLVHDFRVESSSKRTVDEYHALLVNLLQLGLVPARSVGHCIVASVVPPLTSTWVEVVDRVLDRSPLVVGPGVKTGIRLKVDDPRQVGADRVVNAVAAHGNYKGPVIVVDFGTATTFDCVSAQGEYVGGVIAPGVSLSAEALHQRAAKLPRVEFNRPERVIGTNTVHSMQSGLVYGYAAMVDGMVARIAREMTGEPTVVATGGLAPRIGPDCESITEVDEMLTLEGLRLIADLNLNEN